MSLGDWLIAAVAVAIAVAMCSCPHVADFEERERRGKESQFLVPAKRSSQKKGFSLGTLKRFPRIFLGIASASYTSLICPRTFLGMPCKRKNIYIDSVCLYSLWQIRPVKVHS